MEDSCQQDAAMRATFEEEVALAENRMLLTASKNDRRYRWGTGILKNARIVDNVMRGARIQPQHVGAPSEIGDGR